MDADRRLLTRGQLTAIEVQNDGAVPPGSWRYDQIIRLLDHIHYQDEQIAAFHKALAFVAHEMKSAP